MKFYASLFKKLPFIPHWFDYVIITNGKIVRKKWGKERFSPLRVEEVDLKIPKDNKNDFIASRFGWKEATIQKGGARYELPIMCDVNALHETIEAAKKTIRGDDLNVENSGGYSKIPPSVRLGKISLVFPKLRNEPSGVLTIPGSRFSDFTQSKIEQYSWVDKGQIIVALSVDRSFLSAFNPFCTSTVDRVPIRSPVSGLVITSNFYDGEAEILMLKDSKISPNAGEIAFGELCDYLFKKRNYLYKGFRERGTFLDDELLPLIQSLREATFETKAFEPIHIPWIARYQPVEAIDQLKSLFPPEVIEREYQAYKDFNAENRADPSEVSLSQSRHEYPEKILSLMKKWRLEAGYTKAQVNQKWAEYREVLVDSSTDGIDRDREELLQYAMLA